MWRDTREIFAASLQDLQQVWDSVSWKIARERDNPACADAEHASVGNPADPGLSIVLSADLERNMALAQAESARAAMNNVVIRARAKRATCYADTDRPPRTARW